MASAENGEGWHVAGYKTFGVPLMEVSHMERLTAEQQEAGAQTLGEAFHDDPLMRLLVPDDASKRRAVAPWFFSKAIAYGMRWGQVWCNNDASAVAVWFPPAEAELKPANMLRVGMGALPLKVGARGALRFLRALSATGPFHKAVGGPHWYLLAIGTRASRQGQGLGSALMDEGISQADGANQPCYLETATQKNVAFYTKRGFRTIGKAEVEGFTLFGMVRHPKNH
jgi:ribosomal protein S18 acetylase RimI-like enzyme